MTRHNAEQYLVNDFEAAQILGIPTTLMHWFINEQLFIEPVILDNGRKWHGVELQTWMSNNGPNNAIRTIMRRYSEAVGSSAKLKEAQQILHIQADRVALLEKRIDKMTIRIAKLQRARPPRTNPARSFIPTIPLEH